MIDLKVDASPQLCCLNTTTSFCWRLKKLDASGKSSIFRAKKWEFWKSLDVKKCSTHPGTLAGFSATKSPWKNAHGPSFCFDRSKRWSSPPSPSSWKVGIVFRAWKKKSHPAFFVFCLWSGLENICFKSLFCGVTSRWNCFMGNLQDTCFFLGCSNHGFLSFFLQNSPFFSRSSAFHARFLPRTAQLGELFALLGRLYRQRGDIFFLEDHGTRSNLNDWLVVWNMAGLWLSHHIGNVIIPTDELSIIFQRGRYTTNQMNLITFISKMRQNSPVLDLKKGLLLAGAACWERDF